MDLLMSFGRWLEHTSMSNILDNSAPLAITVSLIHYFSFFVLVGTSLLVDLRILGLAGTKQSVTEFTEPFFPWTWTALAFAVLTGFLQSSPDATTLFKIHWYFVKLAVILAGTVSLVIIQRNVRKWDQSRPMPAIAKLIAVASMLLWIASILSATEVPQQANI